MNPVSIPIYFYNDEVFTLKELNIEISEDDLELREMIFYNIDSICLYKFRDNRGEGTGIYSGGDMFSTNLSLEDVKSLIDKQQRSEAIEAYVRKFGDYPNFDELDRIYNLEDRLPTIEQIYVKTLHANSFKSDEEFTKEAMLAYAKLLCQDFKNNAKIVFKHSGKEYERDDLIIEYKVLVKI